MNNHQSWNVITLFLLLIFGFTIATILKPQRSFSERENRVLATRPAPTVSTILSGSFEKDYEDSLTDQFVLRDQWIALRSAVEKLVQKKDIHDVYLGKDGYLIEKHTDTFTTGHALENVEHLKNFAAQAASRYGTEHVAVMVVPNAVDILKEQLPPFADPYDEEEYLARIETSLPKGVWIGVSDVLRKAAQSSGQQLYYRTDHHWTTYGSFLAYQELAQKKGLEISSISSWHRKILTDTFEGTVAARIGSSGVYDSIEAWERTDRPAVECELRYNQSQDIRTEYLQTDYLETRDKYAVFLGGNYALVEISTNANTGRRLLMIKDSYAHCFTPFLLDQFDELDLVDIRYFSQSLSEYMEQGNYTDVLFLYNAAGFAEDASLVKLQY